MVPTVAGYEMLMNEYGYQLFDEVHNCTRSAPPKEYPCFAKEVFNGETDTYYEYLYREDVARMANLFDSVKPA